MDLDADTLPDVNFDVAIQPYQYEPIVRHDEEDSEDDGSDTSIAENLDINIERIGNTDWCDCGNCIPMATGLESKCCQEIDRIDHICMDEEMRCITEWDYFIDNCTRRTVVWISLLEFVEVDGPLDDNEPINEAYRYCAYRRFSRLIYHRLPRKCRKVHPSCVVKTIRAAFPAELDSYTGFKYAKT